MMIFVPGSKFCMSSWFSVAGLVVRPLNSVDITFLSLTVSRHHLTSHPGGPATILGTTENLFYFMGII